MDITEKIDLFLGEDLNEAGMDAEYKKIMKVIRSSTTKAHAEGTRKMIENYYDKLSPNLGASAKVNAMGKRDELLRMLQDHMKKRNDIKISDRELGL